MRHYNFLLETSLTLTLTLTSFENFCVWNHLHNTKPEYDLPKEYLKNRCHCPMTHGNSSYSITFPIKRRIKGECSHPHNSDTHTRSVKTHHFFKGSLTMQTQFGLTTKIFPGCDFILSCCFNIVGQTYRKLIINTMRFLNAITTHYAMGKLDKKFF